MTRPRRDVEAVRQLLDEGLPLSEVARRTGVPRTTMRSWLANGLDDTLKNRIHDARSNGKRCDFCYYVRNLSEASYAYLLGLYLGDGYIASQPRGVFRLRIVQDNNYPHLIRECMVAMNWVIPRSVSLAQKEGCTEVGSYSKHWPCVFPQHGSGRKHDRRIVLEPWQRWVAVERHPELLLRGLIHSDGSRFVNQVSVRSTPYE